MVVHMRGINSEQNGINGHHYKEVPTYEITKDIKSPHKEKQHHYVKLASCCLGIFFCYLYYGIIQEKIRDYKLNIFVIVLMWTSGKSGKDETTPTWLLSLSSLSYIGAMLTSNKALQYVNYPAQVLGKSTKPIPVMLLGVLIAHKRYPLRKYLFVSLIVMGVTLFLYKNTITNNFDQKSMRFGEFLLMISLLLDGVTGALQERMRHFHIRPHTMMLFFNQWSMLYMAIGIYIVHIIGIFITGEGPKFVGFVHRHPYVLWDFFIFGITSALGQHFIFVTVTDFGPLTCSIVTTTRKFFTILASVMFFGNSLTPRQWWGTLLVFAGLFLDTFFGKSAVKKHEHVVKS